MWKMQTPRGSDADRCRHHHHHHPPQLAPEKAIFIFVDEVLPATAALMSAIYEEHKDEDGFLYVSYSGENTL